MKLTSVQAAFIADRSRFKSLLCGRRLGKSHALNLDSALDMIGLRVNDAGTGFESDPDNAEGSSQYHTSITEVTAQANVSQVYANVERFARTGLLDASQWPDGEPNVGFFRLRNGVECRALSGNVKTAGRSRGGSWTADEISWIDLDPLLSSALPMASASLGRPQSFKVRLASSAFVADSTAHRILVGDGGPLDKWAHVSRRSMTLTQAVMEHGFPAPGLNDEQKAAYIEQRRNEVGDDVFFTEYENVFVAGSSSFISPELINACRYEPSEFPRDVRRVVLGVDIARSARGNLTCLQLVSVATDGTMFVHTPITFRGQAFRDLEAAVLDTVARHGVKAVHLDSGGLGAASAEATARSLAGSNVSVRQTQFNATNKAEMLESMAHFMSVGRLRICPDPGLLRDLVALRKTVRPGSSTYSYTASTGTDGSHSDRAIGLALAVAVASAGSDADGRVYSAGRREAVDGARAFLGDERSNYRGPASEHFPELFGRGRKRNDGMPFG